MIKKPATVDDTESILSAVMEDESIIGAKFYPEKSNKARLSLLGEFSSLLMQLVIN